VRILDAKSNTIIKTMALQYGTSGIAFSPNGRFAYVAEPYVGIDVIDANTNRSIRIIPEGSSLSLTNLAVSSNGRFIYATASDGLGATNGTVLKIKS
jgi:DNA-binding beta-propeller fold protein YncE